MATQLSPDQQLARDWARKLLDSGHFYIFDTETTGIGAQDEIIQLGVVDGQGETVISTLVQARQPISAGAAAVHGITADRLVDAPTFAEVYQLFSELAADAPLIAYNLEFDWRMLMQGARRYRLDPMRTGPRSCAMLRYAAWRGIRDPRRMGYRWHKLGAAAEYEGIEVLNAHDAVGDCLMTYGLIRRMAGA